MPTELARAPAFTWDALGARAVCKALCATTFDIGVKRGAAILRVAFGLALSKRRHLKLTDWRRELASGSQRLVGPTQPTRVGDKPRLVITIVVGQAKITLDVS